MSCLRSRVSKADSTACASWDCTTVFWREHDVWMAQQPRAVQHAKLFAAKEAAVLPQNCQPDSSGVAPGSADTAAFASLLARGAVADLALSPALCLPSAEFNRRWQEGGYSQADRGTIRSISLKDLAGRQRAAAEALGELLQAADGVSGPPQPQYRQQGEALVQRCGALWRTGPAALRASWASLQRMGLSSRQVAAVVQLQPAVLAYNWGGEAKQRLLDWVQQELGLSSYEFLQECAGYLTYSAATIAMRADFLRQHRPAVWEKYLSRGTRTLLRLLSKPDRLCARASCTTAELAAFNCAWLATPAGRCWGSKPSRRLRRAQQLPE